MGKDYPVVVLEFRSRRQSKVPYYLSSDVIARHKELFYHRHVVYVNDCCSFISPRDVNCHDGREIHWRSGPFFLSTYKI